MPDDELIALWRYHQYGIRHSDDHNCIASHVCEDILRQRENIYLDDTYPVD